MTTRKCVVWFVGIFVALAGATAGAMGRTPNNVVSPHYRVEIEVLPDGSLDITERIDLNVGPKTITWFEREIPDQKTDGITLTQALMDGRELPRVDNGQGLQVTNRHGLKLRWEFAPTSNASHQFLIHYRAAHVLDSSIDGPLLKWTALPRAHSYPIEEALVSFRAPVTAVAASVTPHGGAIVPSRDTAGLTIRGTNLGTKSTISVDVVFAPNSLHPVEGQWSITEDRSLEMAPAWLIGAFWMLATGLGILVMIGVRLKRSTEALADAQNPNPGPVDFSTPPAVATRLAHRGQSGWFTMLSAFFGLVRDGRLVIEKTSDGSRLHAPTFSVRVGAPASVPQHERWILDEVGATGPVSLTKLMRRLARKSRAFHQQLRAEMTEQGLIDEERIRTNQALRVSGFVLLIAGAIGLGLVGALAMDSYGPWPLSLPGVTIVTALVYIVGSASRSTLTDQGLRQSARWQRQLAELRAVIKGKDQSRTVEDFNQNLPLAVGAGIGRVWIQAFEPMLGTTTDLEWMRSIGSPQDAAASLEIVLAMSAAQASGAGAGGAGAGAGGGSSSAG